MSENAAINVIADRETSSSGKKICKDLFAEIGKDNVWQNR